MKPHARTFDIEENFSIIELEISPLLKKELSGRTTQGQLAAKKAQVKQTVFRIYDVAKKFNELPNQEKNAYLDGYISEVVRAEKILNEIFPELHSDTIKFNFNLFKDLLIDIRLYKSSEMKRIAIRNFNEQLKILVQDLKDD